MNEQQIFKIVGIGIGCVAGYYVFMALLPYIEMFLAICGAWYLYQEYDSNNRNDKNKRR